MLRTTAVRASSRATRLRSVRPRPLARDRNDSSSSTTPEHTPTAFDTLLDTAAKDKSPEQAVLYLINNYNVNLCDVTNRLTGLNPSETRLDVSFSNVKFHQIAPKVNLNPERFLKDITTYPLGRARLPTPLFKGIIHDFEDALNQYGQFVDQKTEEARSRCIATLLDRIVACFKLLIMNTPEHRMEGRFTTGGRIEYQFRVCGSLTVLFIEVKLQIGSGDERLDAIAQVIAEADDEPNPPPLFPFFFFLTNEDTGCDKLNTLSTPIYAILCDGSSFQFFKYMRPTFSLGTYKLDDDLTVINMLRLPTPETDNPTEVIRRLRPICETIYWVFLSGFISGLNAFQSQAAREKSNQPPNPENAVALGLAQDVMRMSVEAVEMKKKGKLAEAEEQAIMAAEKLRECVKATSHTYEMGASDLMRGWDDEEVLGD